MVTKQQFRVNVELNQSNKWENICFIHSKTHIKLHVLSTQLFGPRSLCPWCSDAKVRVAGRSLQRMPKSPLLGICWNNIFQRDPSARINQGCHLLWAGLQSKQVFSKWEKPAVLRWLHRELKPTTCYFILTTVCIECRTINHSDARF